MAEKYALSKSQLAQFSFDSHVKAGRATREGWFTSEIVPIPIEAADGSAGVHATDEGIRFEPSIDAINGVKPIRDNGTMSAAFSSQVCDGAAAVVLASERAVRAMGLQPLAAVRHMSVVGSDPVVMLEAPIPATERVLARAGLRISNIDLYEVNEAFASVPLAWLKALAADPLKLNVNGGAIALGHPLGASGAKLAVTLIHALHRTGGRYGLQTMCEGGGMANATIYERV
jgi:acetyl-CoA C-acetyltransferase